MQLCRVFANRVTFVNGHNEGALNLNFVPTHRRTQVHLYDNQIATG